MVKPNRNVLIFLQLKKLKLNSVALILLLEDTDKKLANLRFILDSNIISFDYNSFLEYYIKNNMH